MAEKSRRHQRSGYGLEEQRRCRTEPRAAYPPIRLHRRVFSFLNDELYNPGEVPDDAPIVDAHEYNRWFLLTLLGKPRYDDRKASEEWKILWRMVQHDPYTEPDDWEDFLRSKRDKMAQNHRARRDEPTNTIYNNIATVSPSGLTTTMPSQLYPLLQPHHWHRACPATSNVAASVSHPRCCISWRARSTLIASKGCRYIPPKNSRARFGERCPAMRRIS